MIHVCFQLHATSNMVSCWKIKLILYVRSTAGAKPPHAKHAYRYHRCTSEYTSNSRLTVSHASENSASKKAVHACRTFRYFHYKIIIVSAEISAHGEFHAQREQYPNSFKYFSKSSPSANRKTVNKLYGNCFSSIVNKCESAN